MATAKQMPFPSVMSKSSTMNRITKAVSLFDQQPNMEQQFLSPKFSIGLLSQTIMSSLAPTDQQILKFHDFLLTYSNRSIPIGKQQRLLTPLK